MTITLTVAGRIATVDATTHVVAGNTYPVAVSLDSEWTGSLYLRVRFGSLYYDIPFASSAASVDVQFPVGYPEVGIGVFSEALEICTCEARVRLLRSILEAGEQVVEFDSDLFDQWAGEVTALLTDDAFDAESTRPVQNAVLTAWKDTVPLDSALVHKTGTETVDGYKTFLQSPVVSRASPGLTLTTTRTPADTGEKFTINGFAGSELRGKVCQIRNASDEYIALRQYKVDGTSGYYDFRIRTDSSGNGWAEAPTFTADNNADTKIVTRAMLASTPTIVHTTGNETVAGNKGFTGIVTHQTTTPTINLRATSAVEAEGIKSNIVLYSGTSNVRGQIFQQRDSASEFVSIRQTKVASDGYHALTLKCSNTDLGWAEAPTYTADNSADGKIVTRSMLAQTPTVVHTTGNETIAGNKNFTGRLTVGNLRWGYGTAVVNLGACCKFYEVSPNQYGAGAEIRVYNDYDLSNSLESHFVYSIGNGPNFTLNGKKVSMSGYKVILAKRASDGVVEVWLKNIGSFSKAIVCEVRHVRSVTPTVAVQSGSEPEVGDTYSAVYEVTT